MSSSFVKTQLKTAREAIANKNFEYAEGLCRDILENDSTNYNALVFLALCLKELNQPGESESAYERAIAAQPTNPLAFTGLLKLYQSENNVQGQMTTWGRLGDFYMEGNDGEKLLESLENRLKLAKSSGSSQDDEVVMGVLQEYLPTSPQYPLIKGLPNVPSPASVLTQIIEFKEKKLNDQMAKELSERRMRLGSDPLPILKIKVEAEFMLASDLDDHYEALLKYIGSEDADQIFKIQEKRLEFLVKKLRHVSKKREYQVKVLDLVDSILQSSTSSSSLRPFSSLACALAVESQNCGLDSKDLSILEAYSTEIIQSTQDSKCLVLKTLIKYLDEKTLDDDSVANLLQVIDDNDDDYLSLTIMADYYFKTKEYVAALDFGARAEQAIENYQTKYDFNLSVLIMDMKLLRANCSAQIGDTIQALDLYKSIVNQSPTLKAGLLGLGKLYIELKNQKEARNCFERILSKVADDVDARFEIGWVLFLEGNLSEALETFKALLQSAFSAGLAHYRLARVYWEMGGEFREDKTYTHAHLIQAVKNDPSFSPSFSFLGDYYRLQENDLVRAIKCYTKAVSINPTDSDATQSLCSIWISQGKLKEAVALLQQVIVVIPRSKWAWKQLGILELEKSPSSAITRFQTSLRILPNDAISWSCLGEAYSREGKYVAALKAIDRAKELNPADYSVDYLKGRIHQKLGQFEESLACYEKVLLQIPPYPECGAAHIPVLHGVVETRLIYAREQYEQGSYGASFENLCFILSTVVSRRMDDASFLKIAGDACLEIYQLLPSMISDRVAKLALDCSKMILESAAKVKANPVTLVSPTSTAPHTINMHQLLNCAYLCYQACIIQTPPDDKSILAAFYYDISLCSHYLFKVTAQDDHLIQAIKFVKTSLSFRPSFWLYWNALGIYCQNADKKLAQHSFIKAIECDSTIATAWCNLGFFYLVERDFELADQCFQKAQLVDLDYPFGWFGHAITSELLGHEKIFELYEHSFELARVSNGNILYQFSKQCYLHPDRHTTPLTSAAFALQKCYEMHFRNPQLLNLYGLVLELQHRTKLAIEMFIEALSLLPVDDHSSDLLKNAIHENLGRCLCAEGDFKESIASYQNIDEDKRDAYTLTGLGLAFFLNQQYHESLNSFQKALAVTESGGGGKDVLLVNNVNLVLSQVLFALGSADHIALAKQQLLSCFASDARFVPALLSLCAMGIVLKDWTLAQTAAEELMKLEPHVVDDLDADVDFVLGSIFAASNQTSTVKRFFAKSIHRYPWKAERWSKMVEFICSSNLTALSREAILLAQNALVISSQVQPSLKPDLQSTDQTSNNLRIAAASLLSAGGAVGAPLKSQRYLSRAILLKPTLAKNWLAMSVDIASRGFDGSNMSSLASKTACAAQAFDTGLIGIWSEAMKIHLILISSLQGGSSESELHAALSVIDGICSSTTGLLQVVGYCLMARGLYLLQNSQAAIQALQQAITLASSLTATVWRLPWLLLSKLLADLDQVSSAIEVLKSCGEGDICAQLLEASLYMMKGVDGRAKAFEIVGGILRRNDYSNSPPAKFLQTLILAQNQELQEEASRKKGLSRITKARSLLTVAEHGQEALAYLDSFINEK